MFDVLKKSFAAAAIALTMGSASNAAVIPFTIDSAGSSVSITNCRNSLGNPSNCDAVASLSPIAGNPTINVTIGGTTTFDFLRFTPADDDLARPDSFDIFATLSFLAPSASFSGSGQGSGFRVSQILGRFYNGAITWANIPSQSIPNTGLVTVSFLDSPPGAFSNGLLGVRSVVTQASISVVPLPAGVLLLGTALLGLFGLSRRRKLAAA